MTDSAAITEQMRTEAQEAAFDAAIMEMARNMGWDGVSLKNLAEIIAEMAETHDDFAPYK